MKHFGIVKSFDEAQGLGSITPEKGGEDLRFERSGISWDPKVAPTTGQRLSYELVEKDGRTSALNLQTVQDAIGGSSRAPAQFTGRTKGNPMDEQTLHRNPSSRLVAVILAFFVVGGALVFAIS